MDAARSLTIGQVSGLIALGNAVVVSYYKVSTTIFLFLGILLVRYRNKTLSAASWSVIGRQLHSTLWPTILQTDTAASANVKRTVSIVAYLNAAIVVLIAISGVVTPLGLGQEPRPVVEEDVRFEYVPDLSTFGRSTQNRPDVPLSRDCYIKDAYCPGSNFPGTVVDQGEVNASAVPGLTASTLIPSNISAMFGRNANNPTVASILDIQYRSWTMQKSDFFNNKTSYPRGIYQNMESLIVRDDIVMAEGIIADMKAGGIGFLNHSAPVASKHDTRWTEDVLWIEPDVSCSNTNLTLEYTVRDTQISANASEFFKSIHLVDDGGFSDLKHGGPLEDWPDLQYGSPDVQTRADRTVVLHNYLSALILNLTDEGGTVSSARYGINVTKGSRYPLDPENLWSFTPPGVLTGPVISQWLGTEFVSIANNGSLITVDNIYEPGEDYPNLFASGIFPEVAPLCSGAYTVETEGVDHNVECGYLFEAPLRVDGGDQRLMEADSTWRSSVNICAGAVKASIKTVSFHARNPASLQSLAVKKIEDKHYGSPSEHPLWAMEDWWYPGSEGAYNAPLWGMVDDSYDGTPGYNFTRASHLYLPFTPDLYTWSLEGPLDLLAGAVAPYAILSEVLHSAFGSATTLVDENRPRYKGNDNLVLRDRWTALSNKTGGAEAMIKLVWTDMMASTTIGTSTNTPSEITSSYARRKVTVLAPSITYNMLYAIPALVILVVWAVLVVGGLLAGLRHRRLFPNLKDLLNDTSVGRVAAAATYDLGKDLLRAPTKEWVKEIGPAQVSLGQEPGAETEELYQQPHREPQ